MELGYAELPSPDLLEAFLLHPQNGVEGVHKEGIQFLQAVVHDTLPDYLDCLTNYIIAHWAKFVKNCGGFFKLNVNYCVEWEALYGSNLGISLCDIPKFE